MNANILHGRKADEKYSDVNSFSNDSYGNV